MLYETSLTGNKRNTIAATYDITIDDHDDLFAAYIAAPEEGSSDLVVENPELIAILDGIYSDAVEDIYYTQITMSAL
ncbi:hypothetical protein [Halorubrum sp. FL23]|uniref:hypothetical protein n=1 Tax=Halorubrum sp. FL23 TaxID=3458704 RepID=UPI0040342D1F